MLCNRLTRSAKLAPVHLNGITPYSNVPELENNQPMMILRIKALLGTVFFVCSVMALISAATFSQAQVTAVVDTPGGDTPPLENPALAMNLAGVADWSTAQPFLNVAKTMRPLFGHMPGQWGGYSHDALRQDGYLDERGQPLKIPEGVSALASVFLTEMPAEMTSVVGRYRLTFSGSANVQLKNVRVLRQSGNEIWFEFTPTGRNLVEFLIHKMDPNDPLRDLVIVHEKNIPLLEAGAIFNPDWIKLVRDLRVLRFMGWMKTNHSHVSTWDQRPRVEDFTYSQNGVPLPLMIALSNEIGADPWFTMPHLADDIYVQTFAKTVRDGLDPKLKAYVEYSNELWNFQFSQTKWAQAQASELWGRRAKGDAWMQYAGMRSAQVVDIWRKVYGDEAPDRLVRVMGVHTAYLGLEHPFLEGKLWQGERSTLPDQLFDAYAVTGYFYLPFGDEKYLSALREKIAATQSDPAGREVVYDGMALEVRNGSLKKLLGEWWPYHAKVAESYGMDLIMYEGGTHIVAHGDAGKDAQFNEALFEFNYSPQVQGLYLDLVAGWHKIGGRLFNGFEEVGKPRRSGSWGHLRHLDDRTGRWDILMAYNRRMSPSSANRSMGSFLHGVTYIAGDLGEDVVGTPQMDILIGGAGDDFLMGGSGNDRLHGRAGTDTALLPGRQKHYAFGRSGQHFWAQSKESYILLRDIEYVMFERDPSFVVAIEDLLAD